MEALRKHLHNFRVLDEPNQDEGNHPNHPMSDIQMAELEELYKLNTAGIASIINNLEYLQKKNSEFWSSRQGQWYNERKNRNIWLEVWLEYTRKSTEANSKECIALQTANIFYCETCKVRATCGWRRGLDGLPVCERCWLSFPRLEGPSDQSRVDEPADFGNTTDEKDTNRLVTNSTNPRPQSKGFLKSGAKSKEASSDKFQTAQGPEPRLELTPVPIPVPCAKSENRFSDLAHGQQQPKRREFPPWLQQLVDAYHLQAKVIEELRSNHEAQAPISTDPPEVSPLQSKLPKSYPVRTEQKLTLEPEISRTPNLWSKLPFDGETSIITHPLFENLPSAIDSGRNPFPISYGNWPLPTWPYYGNGPLPTRIPHGIGPRPTRIPHGIGPRPTWTSYGGGPLPTSTSYGGGPLPTLTSYGGGPLPTLTSYGGPLPPTRTSYGDGPLPTNYGNASNPFSAGAYSTQTFPRAGVGNSVRSSILEPGHTPSLSSQGLPKISQNQGGITTVDHSTITNSGPCSGITCKGCQLHAYPFIEDNPSCSARTCKGCQFH